MRKITKKIVGTAELPRLHVSRSLMNVYAQLINDLDQKTIIGVSSLSLGKGRANTKVSEEVGQIIAEKALKLGIKKVVFDRGGRIYHGRVKAVAEGARKKGLEF